MMNPRMRYLMAAVCAVLAGFLTLVYLGGQGGAGRGETEIVWVARQALPAGTRLAEELLQQVRVDGPTRRLLAGEALPTSPADSPGQWYATTDLAAGQPLRPGYNVANQPAPALPEGTAAGDLRLVALQVDAMPSGTPAVGEEVDLYAIPGKGGEAALLLARTRVMAIEDGLIAVLVPAPQVGPVLTAAEGAAVKVVRHLPGAGS
jgi:hypothetical protein